MARLRRFTFLCDTDERRIVAYLASRLQRSQSDAIRWLIREAVIELGSAQDTLTTSATESVTHATEGGQRATTA